MARYEEPRAERRVHEQWRQRACADEHNKQPRGCGTLLSERVRPFLQDQDDRLHGAWRGPQVPLGLPGRGRVSIPTAHLSPADGAYAGGRGGQLEVHRGRNCAEDGVNSGLCEGMRRRTCWQCERGSGRRYLKNSSCARTSCRCRVPPFSSRIAPNSHRRSTASCCADAVVRCVLRHPSLRLSSLCSCETARPLLGRRHAPPRCAYCTFE
mmetsp:Transcript_28635/g.73454  ORF Transcript_28635/g.73454 Transcript_28635/m.73454 type:complete len:210 (+) Transcript_28635:607-1236(+)